MAKTTVSRAKASAKQRRASARAGQVGTACKANTAAAKSRLQQTDEKACISEVMQFMRSLAAHQNRSRMTVLRVR